MVPSVTLNDGVAIPQLGFGVWQVPPGKPVIDAVSVALDAGYRHIDTAQMYGNEEGVGEAIRRSGIPRDDLFVTTKLNNNRHGEAVEALDESLARLGLEHVDLYLIHWPRPRHNHYVEAWRGFEEAKAAGKTRSIGVSNFQLAHLERLAAETSTVPSVNQIELHPDFTQPELRAYHAEHGIVTEAWSPLGQGKGLLGDSTLASLAVKYGRTPAQVVLRWHLQLGNIVFPRSVTPARIRENFDVFGFELDDDDVATITELKIGQGRLGPNPDTFEWDGR